MYFFCNWKKKKKKKPTNKANNNSKATLSVAENMLSSHGLKKIFVNVQRAEKSTLQTMVLHIVLQAESKLALFLVYKKPNYVTLWIYALIFFYIF